MFNGVVARTSGNSFAGPGHPGLTKKDRITHRIEVTSLDDIDDEVKHWMKVAYDRDA